MLSLFVQNQLESVSTKVIQDTSPTGAGERPLWGKGESKVKKLIGYSFKAHLAVCSWLILVFCFPRLEAGTGLDLGWLCRLPGFQSHVKLVASTFN